MCLNPTKQQKKEETSSAINVSPFFRKLKETEISQGGREGKEKKGEGRRRRHV